MIPRKKLDIGWIDLLAGIVSCFRPGNSEIVRRRIENIWSTNEPLICLSVRSGFDLLLRALAFPRGSEVLMSAVTIRDMVRIVEEHGLVPVPVDLNMRSLSLDMDSLERAYSNRSRALVVAHLFGSRMPMENVVAFAQARGLFLVEDCAQAYTGPEYRGHAESDACMFSFGPIKTNTALGGGILHVKDGRILRRMSTLHAEYPEQKRGWFLKRLVKYVGLKLLLTGAGSTIFSAVCTRLKRNPDDILSGALRGFPGTAFFRKIRKRPGYPLLALLERKLTTFKSSSIERRAATAEGVARRMPAVARPGSAAVTHSHWVFPIQSSNPDALMRDLQAVGMDATRGASSLYVIEPPPGTPHQVPVQARSVMQDVLYLPVYPEVPARDLNRLARIVATFEAAALPDRPDIHSAIERFDVSTANALS